MFGVSSSRFPARQKISENLKLGKILVFWGALIRLFG